MASALQLRDLGKVFGSFWALRKVNIDFDQGEIHALVGENGAGKSTLIKLVAGVYQASEGELVDREGNPLSIRSPRDALAAGIGVVHQELDLFDNLTVAENVALGIEDSRVLKPSIATMAARAQRALQELGERRIKPWMRVGDLTTSDKQLVAIAKVLTWQARVIIFDEPTSALNALEASRLLERIQNLKAAGVTVIYVSHKLGEIFAIADRISVIRDGRLVATRPVSEFNHASVVSTMLGRQPSDIFPERPGDGGADQPVLLNAEGLEGFQLAGASLSLRKGEIVGLAGLPDAGASSMLQHIFGLRRLKRGRIRLGDKDQNGQSPRRAIQAGIAYLPADRLLDGILPLMSVLRNAESADEAMHASSRGARRKSAIAAIRRLSVRTASLFNLITSLSGGNQQKTLLARWLVMRPQVLMLDDPTRGVDIGAKSEIYHILRRIADEGSAVLFTSSDSLELANLADRILLFRDGRVVEHVDRVTHEELDRMIAAA